MVLFPYCLFELGASRSNLLFRVNCVRVCFFGANHLPWVEAQARHRSCAGPKTVQFTAVDSLWVSRFMSFTQCELPYSPIPLWAKLVAGRLDQSKFQCITRQKLRDALGILYQ